MMNKRIQMLAMTMFGILAYTQIQAMDGRQRLQPETDTGASGAWTGTGGWLPRVRQGSHREMGDDRLEQAAHPACEAASARDKFEDFQIPHEASALTTADRNAAQGFMQYLEQEGDNRWQVLTTNYIQYRDSIAKAVILGYQCSEFLPVAIESNDRKLVEHLLAYGTDANGMDRIGRPMILIAQSKCVAQVLQQHGATLTAVEKYTQHTVLHKACYSSCSFDLFSYYINELKKHNLLEKYINNQAGQDRETPLHRLISSAVNHHSGLKECFPEVQKKLTLLLENGADCVQRTCWGLTPQDKINAIIANPTIYREEGTLPFWTKITEQLTPAIEAQSKAKVAKEIAIIQGQSSCAICLEQLEESGARTALSCAHVFHTGCVQPWITTHSTCPICRTKLPVQNNSNNNNWADSDDRSDILPGWYL